MTAAERALLLRAFHSPGAPVALSPSAPDPVPPFPALARGRSSAPAGWPADLVSDPEALAVSLVTEQYLPQTRPWVTRFPGESNFIPEAVRRAVLRYRIGARMSDAAAFPRWPIEPAVEELRRSVRARYRPATEPFWPDGKRYAAVFTHDLDSARVYRERLWEELAAIEEEYGVRSSWHFCSSHLPGAGPALEELGARGHEIAWHGPSHRLGLPFAGPEAIRRTIDRSRPHLERFGVAGFRSPMNFRTDGLYRGLAGSFTYDSSPHDTAPEPFISAARAGCCTVFPFLRHGVVVLPITMPEDHHLPGGDSGDIQRVQTAKLDWIGEVGGLALTLTHPLKWLSLRPGAVASYRALVERIARDPDACILRAREAAEWWLARSRPALNAGGAAAGPA